MKEQGNVQLKSFRFAVRIVGVCRVLQSKREYVISKQLLRSGTSIGANLEEAQGGCSRKEFVSKMTIVYKEARETSYWLKLLRESQILTEMESESLLADCEELLKIIGTIIITLKSKPTP